MSSFACFSLIVLFSFCLFFAGCVQNETPSAAASNPSVSLQPTATTIAAASNGAANEKNAAIAECVALCEDALADECGTARLAECGPWNEGPCVSDALPGRMPSSWVCDVAHSPREPADDEPGNQCVEYARGEAKHFVEVNPACTLIRAV